MTYKFDEFERVLILYRVLEIYLVLQCILVPQFSQDSGVDAKSGELLPSFLFPVVVGEQVRGEGSESAGVGGVRGGGGGGVVARELVSGAVVARQLGSLVGR